MTTKRSAAIQDITLDEEALSLHAGRLALEWPVRLGRPDMPSLEPDAKALLTAYSRLTAVSDAGELPPAAEWLLDNYYLLEENIRSLRESMDETGALPVLSDGAYADMPRAYLLAAELVAHSEGALSVERVERFIQAFQQESALTMGEIWALPLMLRAALIQLSADAALFCLTAHDQIRRGAALAGECALEPNRAYALLGRNELSLSGAFLEALTRRLEADEAKEALTILDMQLALKDIDAKKSIRAAHLEQAHIRVLLGNAITSLRQIASWPWEETFERLSLVEAALREDEIYPNMDGDSRARYRESVERIARRLRVSETHAAKTAVLLSREADERDERRAHVGYYLIGEGRRALMNRLRPGEIGEEKIPRFRMYAGGVAALALIFIALAALGNYDRLALAALICAIPAVTVAKTIMDRFLVWITPPAFMPRLSVSGDEAALRTVVVVPALIRDYDDAMHIFEQLKVASIANPEKQLTFALLADLPNSYEERADRQTVSAIIEAFKREGGRFLFLLRKRVPLPEGGFGGYERKRGALMQFNELLLSGDASAFEAISGTMPRGVRYVITLDADTVLPRGAAVKLIGALAHPLNKPRLSPSGHRVEEGHAVLQPRVAVTPKNAAKTRFARIFSGSAGVDSYTFAVSDVYQDVFDEGSFTGKGIYDLRAFMSVLRGVLPDGRVLSHDLLEGSLARAGLVSDITLYDGYPRSYRSYSRRAHRWTRGDWQLLPFLGSRWKTTDGIHIKNPLSALDRFKIIDNLRRSLVPVAVMASLLLAFSGFPPAWAALSLAALIMPLLMDVCARVWQWLKLADKRPHLLHMLSDLKNAAAHVLVCLLFLPQDAITALDAILRALWRLIVRKRLLEWETAAESERGFAVSVDGCYRAMPAPLLIAAASFALSVLLAPQALVAAAPFALCWALSPLIAAKLALPPSAARPYRYVKREMEELREYAGATWQFFARYMVKEYSFLPPDNVQETPKRPPAKRTSPTNAGLGLLALVCALDLGLINREELSSRMDGALASLERAEKWNGSLYNWYELPSMTPLSPRFVSTVDCGNFIACALAAAQALTEIGEYGEYVRRLLALASGHSLASLYDEKRELFTVGYDAEAGKLSSSHYDLLASEARLASFIAIARGEVPERHWFKLGRSLTTAYKKRALVSWSGTMFEYLMPLLLMEDYPYTLLSETYGAAVEAQRRFTDKQRPWGVSESGFYEFDLDLYYQYRAFGIPRVGLKSANSKDIVVAPYASVLALLVDPRAALNNLRALKALGAFGECGFYEALDYTPERVSGAGFMLVKSYMAHHQGMALVALANVLCANRMRKRFHSLLMVKASELLLQERMPLKSIVIREYREALPRPVRPEFAEKSSVTELRPSPEARPEAHLLGGPDYSVLITSRGGGYSRWGGVNVNRWRADPLGGLYGVYFYIAEQGGRVWSPCLEPLCEEGDFRVRFEADKAVFERRMDKLRSALSVCVSPEYPAELRRLTLTNEDTKGVSLRVSAFFEVSLAHQRDDEAHPAFQNLFVEAKAEDGLLLFTRRKRQSSDPARHLAAALHGGGELTLSSDRLAFTGRGNTPRTASLRHGEHIENPLDPAACFTREIYLKAGETAVLTLALACGEARESAAEIARALARESERVYALAWTHAQVELRALNDVKWFQKAIAPLLFPDMRSAQKALAENTLPLTGLWRLGVSGDWPILLAEAGVSSADNVKLLLSLHEYLRRKGVKLDLVILSTPAGEYHQNERDKLLETIRASASRHVLNAPGGVHLLSLSDISAEERTLLRAAAAFCIDAERPVGPQFTMEPYTLLPSAGFPRAGDSRTALALETPPLRFDNGFGGFSPEGDEYIIRLRGGGHTPLPWCNVMSNGGFGTVVSERGGGFTFAHNARENQLTPWRNDPVRDPLAELFQLRDDRTGRVWRLTSGDGEYIVRHGFGYTRFEHGGEGLMQRLTVFIDPALPVKVFALEITNPLAVERELSAMLSAEWTRARVCALHGDMLACRDAWGGATAFLAFPGHEIACLCDRAAFHMGGTAANWARETSGDGALGAIMAKLSIPPGGSVRLTGLLGEGKAVDDALKTVEAYALPGAVESALNEIRETWRRRINIKVQTPDPAFDIMMNGWLLYQLWSARLLGRTGYYQAGGAYGFRDQLQDALALLHSAPERAREQLLIAAGHQFEAGDVQHWWHPPALGVRTRIKDDRLFLAYVSMAYADATGDKALWDEQAPYLEDVPMGERRDVYEAMKTSGRSGSIFEHCVKAIDATLEFGSHGLPLMGTGDWNDGMDEIGARGRGESVWLGFFLLDVLQRFTGVCAERSEHELVHRYLNAARELEQSLEAHGWDGAWYRRAFNDDGKPIGSAQSAECQIDLISQAWAVLSGMKNAERNETAMRSALERLIIEDAGILRLLAPSFNEEEPSPGYIRGYIPGVRENGGQYTHGAAWALLALCKLGKGAEAVRLFSLLNPISRTATRPLAERYKGEPYVMAADVYSAKGREGRAGWTWYTGSAAWMYQAGLEGLLGITKRGSKLIRRARRMGRGGG